MSIICCSCLLAVTFMYVIVYLHLQICRVNSCGYQSLLIRVIPGQRPYFVGMPYRTTLSLSQPTNSTVYTVTAQDGDLQGQLVYR